MTRRCRFCGISTKESFCGELKTVITLELNIFSKIPMLFLFFTSSAFYRYLSLARQVPGASARTVTHTQTDTHDDYYNLAPSRARLKTWCHYHLTTSYGFQTLSATCTYSALHNKAFRFFFSTLFVVLYAICQYLCHTHIYSDIKVGAISINPQLSPLNFQTSLYMCRASRKTLRSLCYALGMTARGRYLPHHTS